MFLIRLTTTLLLIFSIRGIAQENKLIINAGSIAQEKKEFTISGRIDGIGNSKVLLGNKPRGYAGGFKVRYFDSCMSVNDHFTFKGNIDELNFYSIEVPGKARGWFCFILDKGDIKIVGSKDSLYRSTVTGSSQSDIHNHYLSEVYSPLVREVKVYHDIIDSLRRNGDTTERKRIEREIIEPYNRRIEATIYRFVEENPSSFGALFELNNLSKFMPADSVKKYFLKLSPELQRNKVGKRLKYELFDYAELISLKKPMPDFSLPDTANLVRCLSEFRGKYVLLDFWASWCGPCLEELPAVKRIDSLYASKGLQVVGISLDTKKQLWTQAIIKNNITWPNLSDLEGADGKVSVLLNITAIPAKFLLDPEGNILLKDASLPEMEKLLENRLSN